MKFLVATHRHLLLPLAWRLRREGHDVVAMVVNRRYEHLWGDLLPKAAQGQRKRLEELGEVAEEVREGERWLVTDSERALELLGDSPHVLDLTPTGTPELCTHFVVEWAGGRWIMVPDWGLWPGGQGPLVVAGATLGPRIGDSDADGVPRFRISEDRSLVGAHPVLWHALAGEVKDLGAALTGGKAEHEARWVVAAAVSLPPWPLDCNLRAPRVALPSEVRRVWWHDIEVQGRLVLSGGTDGLLGVVRGAGPTLLAAQQQLAEGLLQFTGIPECQFRGDVGAQALHVLDALSGQP